MPSPNAANREAFAISQDLPAAPQSSPKGKLNPHLFVLLEGPMQRMFLKALTIAFLMSMPAYGQSLGEIAREYREKQNAQEASGAEPKVFTNKDLPANPEGYQAPRGPQPVAHKWDSEGMEGGAADGRGLARPSSDRSTFDRPTFDRSSGGNSSPFAQPGYHSSPQGQQQGIRSGPQGMEGQRGGEQWRQQIQERENRIASMQARIDQMNASVRSGGASAQGPYNRYQSRQAERATEMQMRLDEQKRKLDQMQDAARHAGMHTQVYDP